MRIETLLVKNPKFDPGFEHEPKIKSTNAKQQGLEGAIAAKT